MYKSIAQSLVYVVPMLNSKQYFIIQLIMNSLNYISLSYILYLKLILLILYPIMNKICLLFILLINFSACWEYQRRQVFGQSQQYYPQQQQYWFPQILDHYDYLTTTIWQQRYFVFDNYFNPASGPVILYICGEAECRGISNTSYTARIAEQTKGLVVALEHRYYGKSLPFGNNSLSLQNLRYLTAEQALRDLAYFLTKISKGGQYRITQKNPWITVGGSYPGAMAAWFRNRYPHLTIGSLSSSGVVLAVQDFRMFDQQIYISAMKSGIDCVNAIVETTTYVESEVTGDNKQKFKAQFNASELTARQFLFYWSDVIVFQVQYGTRVNFCHSLKGKTINQQYQIIKALALKVSPVDYGAYYLGNEAFAMADGRGARSWIYQSCTEFSYFQTYSQQHPMRSKLLTIDFYRKWCEDIFGKGSWPFVDRVNNQFGGLDLNVNNLIMTNGDEDPWQWASLQKSNKSQIYAKVITCDNCAHCVDLRGPNANDAPDLTETRSYQMATIKKWINEHWKSYTQ